MYARTYKHTHTRTYTLTYMTDCARYVLVAGPYHTYVDEQTAAKANDDSKSAIDVEPDWSMIVTCQWYVCMYVCMYVCVYAFT